MDEKNLDALLKALRGRPLDDVGCGFADRVVAQVARRDGKVPVGLTAAFIAVTVCLSASIGYVAGRSHEHGAGSNPPPLTGFGSIELPALP